jgi:spermidine synthase
MSTPGAVGFAPERTLLQLAAGALGFSCAMTQLVLMRELLAAFAGNEMVLGIGLGLWLLFMGAGAALGRGADRLRNPLAVLLRTQVILAVVPLIQVFAVRALRHLIFVRGAEVGLAGTVAFTAAGLLPYCLPAGFALTLLCSMLQRGGDAAGAGRVYIADGYGSVLGGALFSLVLVRFCDHLELLTAPAVLNLLVAAGLAWTGRRREPAPFHPGPWEIAIGIGIAGLAALSGWGGADTVSTALQFPGQRVLFHANSPYGRLVVTESAGQTNFIENGFVLASAPNPGAAEEAAHYAMAQRPEARRVLLISGSIAGVAQELLNYPAAAVDCVELDPLVIETGRRFLPDHYADPRVYVIATDARLHLRQTTSRYDVVILALPDPGTAQLNRFFTAEFFRETRRVLVADGVLSFALGRYENYVSPELARLLASAQRALSESFTNTLVLPGGRVFFLASNGPLSADIAARIEERGIGTKLVNRHYLEAQFAPDRLADLRRAVAQPAAVNRDFAPMLYYYHLRHWLSQFDTGFGVVPAMLLVLLGVYLARLRGATLVLFASGFAATSLEIVLLLAFQFLCGSLYYQVGVIVTVFMAGLALGAMAMNRWLERRDASASGHVQADQQVGPARPAASISRALTRPGNFERGTGAPSTVSAPRFTGRRGLAALALAIAGYAVLLAVGLPLLARLGGAATSLVAVQVAVGLLTFILALLVGLQFPLANRLEFDGTPAAAARLYTADFVGACLGALLTSALLIPLVGVAGSCWLTAALNLAAGVVAPLRKAVT